MPFSPTVQSIQTMTNICKHLIKALQKKKKHYTARVMESNHYGVETEKFGV